MNLEVQRARFERETTIEFLRIVNRSSATGELIEKAATFFQRQSGCSAVGIRLRQGDDYPYYEARGFSQEFVLAESSLCARHADGSLCRDSSGHPMIECMCGNVIEGRFDASKPFFTAGGSFWTNNTSELLASTTAAERLARTRNRCNGEGYESVALLPLRVGDQRLGLLQINDYRRSLFSPGQIELWERLAAQLAVAIARAQADDALRRSLFELSVRDEIAQIFLSASDVEMYAGVLAVLLRVTESKYGMLGYIDDQGALVVPTMTRHLWDKCQVKDKAIVFPRQSWGQSAWPRALREQKTKFCNARSTCTPPGHLPILRHVTVPIVHAGKSIGLLQVANKPTDYADQDIHLLETLGVAFAPALDRQLRKQRESRLETMAFTDSLTSLFSRRYLMSRLGEEVESAARHRHQLSLCLCDLDDLNKINHTHGHQMGDQVLAAVGQIIATTVRGCDIAARLGGDEFCIIFPQTGVEQAALAVGRIRAQLATRTFRSRAGIELAATLSCGLASHLLVAQHQPEQQPTDRGESLLERADAALYEAKHSGGDRLVVR